MEKCSEEERLVLDRVEKEMEQKNGKLVASYPWLPCADRMQQAAGGESPAEHRSPADKEGAAPGIHPGILKGGGGRHGGGDY